MLLTSYSQLLCIIRNFFLPVNFFSFIFSFMIAFLSSFFAYGMTVI